MAVIALPSTVRAERKVIEAHPRGDTIITLDGRLDEAVWAEAPIGTNFVERVPYPGSRPEVTTTFRVLYDEERIYVGVTAYLEPGETPRALELSRDDFAIFSDDAISLKIDARLDQRTTVGFVTNPAGAQLDYVTVDNRGFRREYDGIWDVAAQVYEDRWVAEFEIPGVAFFLPGEAGSQTIGLNVTRDHNRAIATYDWNQIPPEFGPSSALHYGRVQGLVDIAGGRTLSLIPYAIGTFDRVDNSDQLDGKVGGDVRFRLASDVWTELTILTDFAQVDLDNPVLNLDRFPLFFPERRPFFLTGLDAFAFGVPGFVQPFFTRRIGLDEDGNVVPLIGGLKVYGSTEDVSFGVLEVVTGEAPGAAAETFTVGRARYNLGKRGHLGLIATLDGQVSRRPNDEPNPFTPGYAVGADATIRVLEERLQLETFWTSTIDTSGPNDTVGHTGHLQLSWRGEELMPSFTFTRIEEEYDPMVGFVFRRDLMRSYADLVWIHRTQRFGLRSVTIAVDAQIDHDADATKLVGQRTATYLKVEFDPGYTIELNADTKEDLVQRSFEIVPDVVVEPGLYRGVSAFVTLRSPSARNPSVNLTYAVDTGLFGGRLHSVRGGGDFRIGPHFFVSAFGNYSHIDFEGRPTTRTLVANGAVRINPSTTLAIDLIGQANALESRAAALFRLRWRYYAGSDLFLIYRENVDWSEANENDARSIAMKLSFRYDAVF